MDQKKAKEIPLSIPCFAGNEMKYVADVVKSGWVSTGGIHVDRFERKIAEYADVKRAVACQNGTSGLHIALLLCGASCGDEVIVPSLTFIAAVNPVRYIGADPVFMDCDESLCMDPNKLESFCSKECEKSGEGLRHKATGKTIKCMVVVHVFGNMADMENIMDIADKYGLKVVEDATEAVGTYYTSGRYAGRHAGTIGHAGIYSFNGNKIITTGGGGMIISNDEGMMQHAKHLTTQAKSDGLYYTHDEVGYNYRMTNLQAALGLAQLEELEGFIAAKRENYEKYRKKTAGIQGLKILNVRQGIRCNHWFYALYCGREYGRHRDEVIRCMNGRHIQVRPVWGLIHQQKPYKGFMAYNIEEAQKYWEHVINIPCSASLTEEEIDIVVQCLEELQKE